MIWKTPDVLPTERKHLIATVNGERRPITELCYLDYLGEKPCIVTNSGGVVYWEHIAGWAYLSEVLDLTAQESWEFSGVSISTGQLVFGGFYRQPNGGPCIVCCDGKELVLVPVVPDTVKITQQYCD